MGKADDLGEFEDKSFDVVFTDAVMMYIGSDKIDKVVSEMSRVARKALVLLEWHCLGNEQSAYFDSYHWRRDYIALLERLIPGANLTITRLPEGIWPDENWKKFGAAIEVVVE